MNVRKLRNNYTSLKQTARPHFRDRTGIECWIMTIEEQEVTLMTGSNSNPLLL